MNAKKGISIGVTVVLVLLLVWTGIVAASMGSETSQLDTTLKAAVNRHEGMDELQQQLNGMGYQVSPGGNGLQGVGPKHSILAYSTWLTLTLDFDQEKKNTGYHIDRASSWF